MSFGPDKKKKKLSRGSHLLGCQFQSHGKHDEASGLVVIALASHQGGPCSRVFRPSSTKTNISKFQLYLEHTGTSETNSSVQLFLFLKFACSREGVF